MCEYTKPWVSASFCHALWGFIRDIYNVVVVGGGGVGGVESDHESRRTEKGYLRTKKGYLRTEKGYLRTEKGYLCTEKDYLRTEKGYLLEEKG